MRQREVQVEDGEHVRRALDLGRHLPRLGEHVDGVRVAGHERDVAEGVEVVGAGDPLPRAGGVREHPLRDGPRVREPADREQREGDAVLARRGRLDVAQPGVDLAALVEQRERVVPAALHVPDHPEALEHAAEVVPVRGLADLREDAGERRDRRLELAVLGLERAEVVGGPDRQPRHADRAGRGGRAAQVVLGDAALAADPVDDAERRVHPGLDLGGDRRRHRRHRARERQRPLADGERVVVVAEHEVRLALDRGELGEDHGVALAERRRRAPAEVARVVHLPPQQQALREPPGDLRGDRRGCVPRRRPAPAGTRPRRPPRGRCRPAGRRARRAGCARPPAAGRGAGRRPRGRPPRPPGRGAAARACGRRAGRRPRPAGRRAGSATRPRAGRRRRARTTRPRRRAGAGGAGRRRRGSRRRGRAAAGAGSPATGGRRSAGGAARRSPPAGRRARRRPARARPAPRRGGRPAPRNTESSPTSRWLSSPSPSRVVSMRNDATSGCVSRRSTRRAGSATGDRSWPAASRSSIGLPPVRATSRSFTVSDRPASGRSAPSRSTSMRAPRAVTCRRAAPPASPAAAAPPG